MNRLGNAKCSMTWYFVMLKHSTTKCSYSTARAAVTTQRIHETIMKLCQLVAQVTLGLLSVQAAARALGGKPSDFIIAERAPLQDIVTWDEHSLFVHGERVIFWGGEVHPFRFACPFEVFSLHH